MQINYKYFICLLIPGKYATFELSGYHADTPITIKAEAIHEADSRFINIHEHLI